MSPALRLRWNNPGSPDSGPHSRARACLAHCACRLNINTSAASPGRGQTCPRKKWQLRPDLALTILSSLFLFVFSYTCVLCMCALSLLFLSWQWGGHEGRSTSFTVSAAYYPVMGYTSLFGLLLSDLELCFSFLLV